MNYIPNPSHIYIYTHTPISRVLKLRNPIFQIKNSNFIIFFLNPTFINGGICRYFFFGREGEIIILECIISKFSFT